MVTPLNKWNIFEWDKKNNKKKRTNKNFTLGVYITVFYNFKPLILFEFHAIEIGMPILCLIHIKF